MMEHFIRLYSSTLDNKICSDIINKFEDDDKKRQGRTATGINLVKRSMDLPIPPSDEKWKSIDNTLFESAAKCFQLYSKEFTRHFSQFIGNINDSGYVIQKYKDASDGYDEHIDIANLKSSERILTGIWYLNNVEEGGETVFPIQNVTIKPQAGSFLIFPPNFMYLHQGKPPISGPKYIITTFFIFTS